MGESTNDTVALLGLLSTWGSGSRFLESWPGLLGLFGNARCDWGLRQKVVDWMNEGGKWARKRWVLFWRTGWTFTETPLVKLTGMLTDSELDVHEKAWFKLG